MNSRNWVIVGLALACAILAWSIVYAAPASAAGRHHRHHHRHMAMRRAHAPGNASVYGIGDGNCGSMTASGERFDCRALTAAHKTIRLGSMVSVCHSKTKLCVLVRINDRGPYIVGREIDLSPTAAHAISCDGLCDVSIHLISEPEHDIRVASNDHPRRYASRHRHRRTIVASASREPRADRCVLSRSRQAMWRTKSWPYERGAEGARYCLHVPSPRRDS